MAYVSKEDKAEKAPKIKALCKEYGVRASISIRHYSTLVVTIQKSPFDVEERNGVAHEQINPHYIEEHHEGKKAEFLSKLHEIMNEGNHDNSDPYTDYHDVGFYTRIQFGKWNKGHVKVEA